jgi:hypothetical protein
LYAVIVTRNHNHFHQYALKVVRGEIGGGRSWGLMTLHGPEIHHAARVRQLITIIEYEYKEAHDRYQRGGLLMHMSIYERHYTIYY